MNLWMRGGATLWVGLILLTRPLLAGEPSEEARWWGRNSAEPSVSYPYIAEPIGSWVYDEVERQVAQGNLQDLTHHTRPYPRSLIAARVAEARAAGKRSIGLERLARELAWETRMMGLDPGFRDTRPWLRFGPPESMAKFNGLVNLGGSFEEGEAPVIGPRGSFGFRGTYWGPPGFGMVGEYLVMDTPGAAAYGDPIFTDTDIQFNTPRYAASWHGRFFHAWAGRENIQYGPGRLGGLVAGGGGPNFAQFGYQISLGNLLTATAVHGWLSQAEHRYVAYHRLEANLGKGLRFGISEGVRYDAAAPEPLYLVNLVPYSAVERLLTADGSPGADRDSLFRSNWMFEVDLYWNASPGWAVYGEVLVDDIVRNEGLFDSTVEEGTPWRTGYQVGATRIFEGVRRLSLQAEYTRINNYTYSVFYGRDFYHQEEPLGYRRGADISDLNLWADLDLDLDWSLAARLFHMRTGEGNGAGPWCPAVQATDNPFGTNCQTFGDARGSVFAGVVERRIGGTLGGVYSPTDNLRLELHGGWVSVSNLHHVEGSDKTRPIALAQASWRW